MHKKKKNEVPSFIAGIAVFGYAGYLVAGAYEPGKDIYAIASNLEKIFQDPLKNWWNDFSLIGILAATLCFELYFVYSLVSKKNYMHGKEYGTAQWANPTDVNLRLADLDNSVNNHSKMKFTSMVWATIHRQ